METGEEMESASAKVCPNPVFIIGSARSGTTALAWSLGRHSDLFNLNETTIIDNLLAKGRAVTAYELSVNRPAPTMLKTHDVTLDEYLQALGTGINALFTSRSKGKRWIDKTLQHTLIVDLVAQMFPGARFLHMLRDGRRVVNSMVHFHNAPSREKQRQQFGPLRQWDFRNACFTWSRYVEAALDFAARQPNRCLTVSNEELIANPAEGFHKIFEFIDAPHEDAPANYFATHQLNSSFSPGGRIDSPLPSRFSDPWETWTAEQQHTFREHAGPTMVRCGFELPKSVDGVAAPPMKATAEASQSRMNFDPAKTPCRTFILLSIARSGSNLLRDYLNQNDYVRCFGEVFKKAFVNEKDWQFFAGIDAEVKRLHAEDLVAFWKLALERCKLDRPVVGAKLFYYHREGDPIWRYLASSRTPIVHLLRENLLDSYLSLKLAEASGVWAQPKKATQADYERNISVDLADFEKYCRRVQRYVEKARTLFKDSPCLDVSYSSLISDREKVMAAVYDFLEVPNEPTTPGLLKQRQHNPEDLIINWDETAKFVENHADLCTIR